MTNASDGVRTKAWAGPDVGTGMVKNNTFFDFKVFDVDDLIVISQLDQLLRDNDHSTLRNSSVVLNSCSSRVTPNYLFNPHLEVSPGNDRKAASRRSSMPADITSTTRAT
ncbi:uncharacterized protein BT62DRAFT_1000896 [Guyanagaster necrorhizus]|uniref:Uncharacterized protein n=1 Tax=Guyanagaster necrorhizus TaxID=856835 RepID=A0A9P8AXR0_9AGAR|nr:uncharacterized protein BT62DRAFT_1000896 [Guyanagaster necrorhizus MCA 3950]KAG7451640.1 hypothetical protein BT62DRAFT_1000896 [Guyanagaster necrorhizus MCA 3950]